MNVSPEVDLQGHLHLDPHISNEFNFASDPDKVTTCCCWCFYRSRPARKEPPKELYVNKHHEIEEWRGDKAKRDPIEARLKANRRLAEILRSKFHHDGLLENEGFDSFVKQLNEQFDVDHPITPERLVVIVNAMSDIRVQASSISRSESMTTSPEENGHDPSLTPRHKKKVAHKKSSE